MNVLPKPTLILYDDIIFPIETAINEMELIKNEVSNFQNKHLLKSIFAYSFSLLEGALSETLERFISTSPNKIMDIGKVNIHHHNILDQSNTTLDLMQNIANEMVSNLSYERLDEFLIKFSKILEIPSSKHKYTRELKEAKNRRNILIHNNLRIDSKYIRNTKCSPHLLGHHLSITEEYLVKTLEEILSLLKHIHHDLRLKYSSHTNLKLIQDLWNYWILRFEWCQPFRSDGASIYGSNDAMLEFISIIVTVRMVPVFTVQMMPLPGWYYDRHCGSFCATIAPHRLPDRI